MQNVPRKGLTDHTYLKGYISLGWTGVTDNKQEYK